MIIHLRSFDKNGNGLDFLEFQRMLTTEEGSNPQY